MFPKNTGTAIVTALYPTDEASRWEPMFEATIARARGVATRVPPVAPWLYGAWGSAGSILGMAPSPRRSRFVHSSRRQLPRRMILFLRRKG
jgi:hypothetical protein